MQGHLPPSEEPAAPPPAEAELFALELRWYEGRMLPYAEWLDHFVQRHRTEILARAGTANTPESLVEATKQLIVDRGSMHLAGELKDQLREIENELWYRGEKGEHDRAQIQLEWTACHADAWRRWRIREYLFVADRCAGRIVARLTTPWSAPTGSHAVTEAGAKNDSTASPPARPQSPPGAIIFDLYGTLLRFNQRAFVRDLAQALGVPVGNLGADRLRPLLLRRHPTEEAMLAAWCQAAGVELPATSQLEDCHGVIRRHLARIRPHAGARTLLRFLQQRGVKLGLLSNTAEPFTQPLQALGLHTFFSHVSLSCHTGRSKPEPEAYLDVCRALEVAPAHCLFIGDSPGNDYEAPRSLGMRAICLRRPAADGRSVVDGIEQLMWRLFDDPPAPLVASGRRVSAHESTITIGTIASLAEEVQGRYNIVGKLNALADDGQIRE